MNILPNSWLTVSLSDICERIVDGSHNPPKAVHEGFPMLSARNIKNRKINFDEFRFISKADFTIENSRTDIKAGDVLLTIVGSIGRTAVVSNTIEKFSVQRSVAILKPLIIDSRYLAYSLESPLVQKYLFESAKGSAQKGIYLRSLMSVEIPLAPLNEQKRIADKLDTLFVRIDACCDRLARIPQILEKFRQSVLADAISGYLTEDWRSLQELPNEWRDSTLSELCLSITDGDHQAPPQVENGIPFITISAINDKQLNLNKATRFVPHSYFNALNDIRKAQFGDILFSVTGSIGIPAIVNTSEPFVFQRHIAILKPDSSQILNEFLFYYLCTDDIREQAINSSTGTAQKTIPLSKLKSFVISLPSKDEQQEIVCRIKRLFSYVNCVERHYQTTLEKIEELKSLILEQAFRGELVSPEPNDEPASVLLERIYLARKSKTAKVTSAQARQRKSKSDMLTQSKTVMLTRNNIQSSHLSDILKANGSMTAKNLWDISQLLIDDFYDQLKDEEASGLLKEKREESTDVLRLLEAV